uniref:Uncharacterized protein n=1 Tax=Roseihalotalea indica TaxID=2867963 RepID=A0AA49PZK3_9BACT|nr:hypothetical protein K4G66_15280 [Tunicatimonas sp. TK19036]
MKKVSKSQEYLLYRVQVTTEAVLSVPELQKAMAQHTYHSKKVEEGQQIREKVRSLQIKQEVTQGNARKAQNTLQEAKETIQALYIDHLETARFIYRRDEEMQRKLRLTGSRKRQYTQWLAQVKRFYQHVEDEMMERYDVPAEELQEARQLMERLLDLEVLRNDARRQSQQASQAKQAAFLQLREWYCRFMRVAKIACEHDQQMLESLGIAVPN